MQHLKGGTGRIRIRRTEFLLVVLLWAAILIGGADAFHVKLHAPPYVVRGGSAMLTCNHSVDRDYLHKVEWLKDGDRKLFQFVRGRKPPFRNFSIPGATLDWSRSNEREILLTGLELEASGVYSCEVSMETPIYTKPSNEEVITVIQRQAEDPEVWGRKPSYVVGESLEVNCTSAPSHPPAHITWLVNGRQVSKKSLKWFPGHNPHPYHHHYHHLSHGHHYHHHHQHHHQHHHRQYRVHSEEEGMFNAEAGEMGDEDDLDMDLDPEPAVLPAVSLAPASSTVQLTYEISEENALEGQVEEDIEAGSQNYEDNTIISGRVSITCLATIPGFIGAGSKAHEYADHRLTSVDVDVIVPAKIVVREEPVIEEHQEEEEIPNSAPKLGNSLFGLTPILPLLEHFVFVLNSLISNRFMSNPAEGQSPISSRRTLFYACPCR